MWMLLVIQGLANVWNFYSKTVYYSQWLHYTWYTNIVLKMSVKNN